MSQEKGLPRIAIVTGASRRSGIGAATCRSLAQAGVDIFFTYWSPFDSKTYGDAEDAEPHQLQTQLRSMGRRCEYVMLDLGNPNTPKLILDTVEARLGLPSILVNNAAHDEDAASFDQLTATTLDIFYAVNIRGPILLSTEFARRFTLSSGGRIINLTSGQGHGPMPGKLPYITTKGAIEAFTVTLAAEVASRGITVNAIDPGPTDTGWMTEEVKQTLLPSFPQGRIGQPADAARLISFLASAEAEWITGQIIRSRGGA